MLATPCIINSVAPIRVCDNGGWTDTWFAERGSIFNIGVYPYVEVQIEVRPRDGARHRVILNAGWVQSSPINYFYFLPAAAVVTYLLLRLLSGQRAPVIAGALAGSLTNTVGVLGLVTLRGILPPTASAVVAVVHGLPEAAVAVLLTVMLYNALEGRASWRRE